MVMTPSDNCLKLIKESEGLERRWDDGNIHAYLDPVGIPTIGYGSIFNIDAGIAVAMGDAISEADALRWLRKEVEEKAASVISLCKVEITQGMFDALVSLTFNIGSVALEDSTLLSKLNAQDYEGAARQFDRWVHGDGQVLPGLVIRRDKEEALFRQDGFPGDQTEITPAAEVSADKPYQEPELPLKIQRTLKEGVTNSEDCYILNCTLAKLGFLGMGTQPNRSTPVTRKAVSWFQSQNNLEVDGEFGLKSRTVLTNLLAKTLKNVNDPMLGRVYCRLTRTGEIAYDNLEELLLEFVSPQGNVLSTLKVVSGAPGHQNFRTLDDPQSVARNLEPIPQERYGIADIQWASGKDDYEGEFQIDGNGLGPLFIPIIIPRFYEPNGRDSFGFHIDWNRDDSPGSAGCVCAGTEGDLKDMVRLFRLYDPRDLFVDWEIR